MIFNKVIFLTGFPGFIAEKLVVKLADAETKFFLIVQNQFAEKANKNITKIAAEKRIPVENFVIVEGDITKENLGIKPETLQEIETETTDVFHLAAVYDLGVKKDLAFSVNVEGTKNINYFVKNLPNLNRYNYISTCYVAGKRTGEIYENELEHDTGFRNYYEETKYLAEIEVEKLKKETPLTIFRPSVVVGDSKTGETAKYDGIYSLILYLLKSPSVFRLVNVGNEEVRLNLVPVDFVVETIAVLSKDKSAVGKTIAVADPNPLTTKELFDEISRTLTGKTSLITPPTKLVEKSLMLPVTPIISGLPHEGVPYFFLSQTYDTGILENLIKPHKIECPDFRTYVKSLVEFVEKHPKLEKQ